MEYKIIGTETMTRKILLTILITFIFCGIASADEPIDLIAGSDDVTAVADSGYVVETSWTTSDPFGEFDPSLGAAAALNRALGQIFDGHASPEQLELQRRLVEEHSDGYYRFAPFAVDVLNALLEQYSDAIPEPIELKPFELTPSEVSVHSPGLIAVRYDQEEYLERLLQRLYFKLIQGPVLMTVPYQADAPSVPEEYRDWNNFQYASTSDTMQWDDTRLVWVDWDLTQTVVLRYENGRIACYDSDRKYYIDHTAAVASAGAMLAHPDLQNLPQGTALNFVLASAE